MNFVHQKKLRYVENWLDINNEDHLLKKVIYVLMAGMMNDIKLLTSNMTTVVRRARRVVLTFYDIIKL